MFKYLLCILVVILVFLVVHMSISKLSGQTENFQGTSADVVFNNPDLALRNQLSSQLVDESDTGASEPQTGANSSSRSTSSTAILCDRGKISKMKVSSFIPLLESGVTVLFVSSS